MPPRRAELHQQLLCAIASLALSSSRFANRQASSAFRALEALEASDGRAQRIVVAKRKLAALNAVTKLLLACSDLQLSSPSLFPTPPTAKEQP